jgi:hypothetical protein
MASNTVRDALAEGLAALNEATPPASPPAGDEGTPAPAGEATPPEAAPSSEGGEGTGAPTEPVAPPAGTNTAEPPTEYFGVPLDGLPPEARAEIISGYQERDQFIQKLLRDKAVPAPAEATPPADPAPAPADAGPEDLSDKEILETLGLDPEFETPETKAIVALARMNVTLHEQVTAVSTKSQLNETERYWETSLSALEQQYGTLPPGISHDDVLREAANANIAEPMDAYWRIMGPGRSAVLAEVTKRRAAMEEALKKGTQSQRRPSSEADTSEKIIDAKDSKSAVKMAFAQLVKEQGLTLPEYGDDD